MDNIILEGISGKAYLSMMLRTPNTDLIEHSFIKDKKGNRIIYATPKIPGMDLTKLWWPESIELQIKTIMAKKERTKFEQELLYYGIRFFENNCADPDAFVDFDTYKRFCNTFVEDFFN